MKKGSVLPAGLTLLLLAAGLAGTGQALTSFVNPFIGTREMGHTFPGACVPFGFVQLSPDTDTVPYELNGKYNPPVYRYCAGYQYDDPTIVGFSHTHFNGTGHSDLGDFLVMPAVGRVQLNPGTASNPEKGYRSRYRKETEKAEPGYYRVFLDEPGVLAELTATEQAGFHRYTFPASDSARIILDLVHGIYNYEGKVLSAHIRVVNDTLVTGYRITRGWARTRYLYFAMAFSRPFKAYGLKNEEQSVYRGFWRRFNQEENFPEMSGRKIRAHFEFNTGQGEQILVKTGLSATGMEGAMKNLAAGIRGWDFDEVRASALAAWERELGRISISAETERMVNFYTALYHTLQSPVIYQDVDGRYRGVDHEIHRAEGFTNYTIFSLWDTYRAEHPLLALLYPGRTADMVNSMLAHFDQSPENMLPVWSHHGNENWCMIGYHAVPVVADAVIRGIPGIDPARALRACVVTANNPYYEGITDYRELGYVPSEVSSNSASVTLEYAYDDYTISRLATLLSASPGISEADRKYASEAAKAFGIRSQGYQKIFDPKTGFMRARRRDGTLQTPFDPLSTHGQGFIEGNAWNYSFYLPHDVPGMISLFGGDQPFVRRLDSLFTMHLDDRHFAETEDVTRSGIMGNYVHGNEPSHHIPYLYNWTTQPWKTHERVHSIINTLYRNEPDGLCGNDDCGQMSAWYIFSALGFYPVCPGSGEYALGSPGVGSARVELPGKPPLLIEVRGSGGNDVYARSVTWNGKLLNRPFIGQAELEGGGTLIFETGPGPK